MNDKVVKKTQDTLGKIIKKPPMTDKLLNRPPFRFLHDVMTSVIKQTGFMQGLYGDPELNSENIKDKESKIAFLQKAIDAVVAVSGKSLSVRPSKVVSGHEPEKTNEFLQALADAINKQPNNEEVVKKVLGGDKADAKGDAKPPKKEGDTGRDKDREGSSDKRRRREKEEKDKSDRKNSAEDSKRSRSKDGRKEKDSKERDSSRDKKERDNGKGKDRGDKEEKDKDRDRKKRDEKTKMKRPMTRPANPVFRTRKDKEKEDEKKADDNDNIINGTAEHDEEPPARIPRPSSAKGSRRRHKNGRKIDLSDNEDEDEQRQREERQKREDSDLGGGTVVGDDNLPPQVAAARKMARPSSARPAPPKIKKQDVVDEDPQVRIGSGKPVNNLIVDDGNDDDDDIFMVEESEPQPDQVDGTPPQQDIDEDGDHGGLVKKILETKKELESGSQKNQVRKQEPEKPLVSDATRRKEREMVQKEIEKLRSSIQTLTRSANPLGKTMDYVQEDLDSMQKELAMWRKENKQHGLELKRESSITESSIEPLKAQLAEIDQAIEDQVDLIATVKHNILRNDEKINKMLTSVAKS